MHRARSLYLPLLAALTLPISLPPRAAANDRATADEVVIKVEAATRLIAEHGDTALGLIADPAAGFVWKDTYVFVVNCDLDRVMVNPAFPERVGGDIKQHTDYAGVPYGLRLCEAAARPGGGWIEYTWPVPGSDTGRRKVSYVRSVPGTPYQVGAGIYDATTDIAELTALLREPR